VVTVPHHLAGPVRDLLVTGLWDLAKANGGTVHPDLRTLIEQLHQADRHPTQVPPTEPAPPPRATVEVPVSAAAEVMGASREYVRRLARRGVLPARRVGRVWLITIDKERARADRH
jgi:excisionase family DNA binding protein